MPSRDSKIKRLRENVASATERAIRADQQTFKRELTQKEKEKYRKDFERSAQRIDRDKLHEVWND